LQETTGTSPQRTEQMNKEAKDQIKRIRRSVVTDRVLNIQNVNLVMNGILLAMLACATIAVFGWTSYLDEGNRKTQAQRYTTIMGELESQQTCMMEELRRLGNDNVTRSQENDANIQRKHDMLLLVFQEICKETRLSTPYPIKLTRGHTNEDFATMVRIAHWNGQWRENHNTTLQPTAFFHCPRDLPKPQTSLEWKRLTDVFYIESGLEIQKPTNTIPEALDQDSNIPITSIDQVDLDHLCRTPICIEPNVLYSGKETKCQYCMEICCNCNNCEKYRGFFQIRTANINTGQVDKWDYNRQQLVRSINQRNQDTSEKLKLRQVMKALYQEAKQKQPDLPRMIEYLADDDLIKKKIRHMAEEIMEGPKIRMIMFDRKTVRLAEELNHELLKLFLSKHNVMQDKMKAIMDWILQQRQREEDMKGKVLTKGGSDVVVISDSNMSLSELSEGSVAVNVDGEITTNDTVWMKEGDTTEDENSITINED